MPELDPASMIVGELKGQFAALEKYIHTQFHNLRNEDQIKYNYFERILRELRELREGDQKANSDSHDELEERISALEAINTKRDGLWGGLDWFLKSPLIAWIAAAGLWVWAYVTGRVQG